MAWLLMAGMLAAGPPERGASNQALQVEAVNESASPATPDAAAPATTTSAEESKPTGRVGLAITPSSRNRRISSPAKNGNTVDAPSPTARTATWWVSTIGGLVVVLIVLFAGGKALRSMAPGLTGGSAAGPIQILYRLHLAPKHSVCLLRCGDRLLLVGVTADSMHTLAEITEPEEIDFLKGQCMQVRPRSAAQAFAGMFAAKGKVYASEDEPPDAAPPVDAARPEDAAKDFLKQLHAVRERIFGTKAKANP